MTFDNTTTNILTYFTTNSMLESESEVCAMKDMTYALDNLIPITLFNRGQASRIFSEVKAGSPKIVVKNNEPEVVLISPADYKEIMEKLEDFELLQMVRERGPINPDECISQEELQKEFGITDEDLTGWEEIELE